MFVALATVKLKSLISEDAVQLCGKRVGAREMRSVSSETARTHRAVWDSTAGLDTSMLSATCLWKALSFTLLGAHFPQRHLQDCDTTSWSSRARTKPATVAEKLRSRNP